MPSVCVAIISLDENGMVKGVELKDGKGYIECDAVVLGAGQSHAHHPHTYLSGIACICLSVCLSAGVAPTCHKFVEGVQVHSRDGSIICDPFMK